MQRREFLRITGGVLATLALPESSWARSEGVAEPELLEAGLAAMARAQN